MHWPEEILGHSYFFNPELEKYMNKNVGIESIVKQQIGATWIFTRAFGMEEPEPPLPLLIMPFTAGASESAVVMFLCSGSLLHSRLAS